MCIEKSTCYHRTLRLYVHDSFTADDMFKQAPEVKHEIEGGIHGSQSPTASSNVVHNELRDNTQHHKTKISFQYDFVVK